MQITGNKNILIKKQSITLEIHSKENSLLNFNIEFHHKTNKADNRYKLKTNKS